MNASVEPKPVAALRDLQFLGQGLVRPECVLATAAGDLYSADWRGGVAHLRAFDDPERGASAYELAEAYCEQARLRVEEYFDQLWRNTDDGDRVLARKVLAGDYEWLEAGVLDQSEGTGPWIADARPRASTRKNLHRKYR